MKVNGTDISMIRGDNESITVACYDTETQYKLSTTASAASISMFFHQNGVEQGTAWTSTAEPTTDTIVSTTTVGTVTPEILNSPTSGVMLRVRRTSNTGCNYSFDYAKITVDYTYEAPQSKYYFIT